MKLRIVDIILIFLFGFSAGFGCYYSLLSEVPKSEFIIIDPNNTSSSYEAGSARRGTGFFENKGVGSFLKSTENKPPLVSTCPYFEITAYCPCKKCCGRWSDGMTASGHTIVKDDKFVAAPPFIPFGTLLAIDGYAGGLPVPVLDRGGAIKGKRLDVFFNNHNDALFSSRR